MKTDRSEHWFDDTGAMAGETDLGAGAVTEALSPQCISLGAGLISGAFSACGDYLAAGLDDGRLAVLSYRSDDSAQSFAGSVLSDHSVHEGPVRWLVRTGKGFISSSNSGPVLRHTIGAPKKRSDIRTERLFGEPGQDIEVVAVHPKGRLIAIACGSRLWCWRDDGSSIVDNPAMPDSISGIAFSASGQRLVASHRDGVSILDLAGKRELRSLPWPGRLSAVTWSPDEQFIAAATDTCAIHVWDLHHDRDYQLGGFDRDVRQLSWSPRSNWLATTGGDSSLLWQFSPGGFAGMPPQEMGFSFNSHTTAIAASPESLLVATGFSSGAIQFGLPNTGEALIASPGNGPAISTLFWCAQGKRLAAGTDSGHLYLFPTPYADSHWV